MNSPLQIITRTCNGAIEPYRLVTLDPSDITGKTVVQAAGEDVPLYGVTDSLGGADGKSADIITSGQTLAEYGGTVTINDPLTSDATGRAIPAPASIATVEIIGWANESGVVGDIASIRIAQARLAQ